jgi:hypothetical protein
MISPRCISTSSATSAAHLALMSSVTIVEWAEAAFACASRTFGLSMQAAVSIMPRSNLDRCINATLIFRSPNCENWQACETAGQQSPAADGAIACFPSKLFLALEC